MRNEQLLTQHEPQTRTTAGFHAERCQKRISGKDRRERLLETAATQFAITGLHGTTTAALAKAAAISEPILYLHFGSKDQLFREAVEHNVDKRLRALNALLAPVADQHPIDCVASMAEATVLVCVSDVSNAILTNWALLEAPEFAADLHRREIGDICSIWDRLLAARFSAISLGLVPYTVHACLAYGYWLASLRHNTQTAAPLAREFAAGIARAASAFISRL